MMTSRSCRLLAVVALGAAAPAAAQLRDTTQLAPIVVTATRSPAATNTLANSVTVLDGDDLVRAGITTVSDAVRELAGVAVVRSGSYGAVTSLFLRGGQSNYVRVLVDGVPVNEPGGYLDLANLSTLNVERIELVRGPASVLYGSDAVSGVMQIFTRRPGARRVELAAGGGTYGRQDVSAELASGGPRAGASLAAGSSRSDGIYPFNNRYANTTLSGAARFSPGAGTAVALAARYDDALFHYPTDGTGAAVDSNQYQVARVLTASLDAGRFFTRALEGRLLLGYGETRARTDNAQDNAADTTGIYEYHSRDVLRRGSADFRVNLHGGPASVLTVGGAVEWESARDTNDYRSAFGPGGGSLQASRGNRALYAEVLSGWADRAWIQAGLRLDRNDRFGSFGTWRLGATARLAGSTRVRVNVGTAFKEPSLDENYATGFTVGNPDLRPERSSSVEIGMEQGLAGLHGALSAAWFDQRFRDMIQYAYLGAGMPNYFNVAGAGATGLEVEARARPVRALHLTAQLTLLRTSVADSGYDGATFAPGRPLIRRPARSASLSAEIVPAGPVAAGLRVGYVGRREDLDFRQYPAARVLLPAYTKVDAWADFAVVRPGPARAGLTLQVRLENAFDAAYTEVFGFRTPGRTLRAGVRLTSGG